MNKDEYIKSKISSYYKNKYKNKELKKIYKNKSKINRNKSLFDKIYEIQKRRIYKVMKDKKLNFKLKYENIIGCTVDKLEDHIIGQFKDNMNLENYGEWEVDHIIPVIKNTHKSQIYRLFSN